MSAPYCRTANELPDLRLWLRDEWRREAFVMGTLAREGGDAYKTRRAVAWELANITEASLWWVSADMVDLLLAAVESVPDEVMLSELPAPASSGLVVFEKPWLGQDSNDPENVVQVDMLVWGAVNLRDLPGREGEALTCLGTSTYRRLIFEDGLSGMELQMASERAVWDHATRRKVGRYTKPHDGDGQGQVAIEDDAVKEAAAHGSTLISLKSDTTPGENAYALSGAVWLPLGRSDWPSIDALGSSPWDMEPYKLRSFVEDRRIVAALWTLTAQEGVADRRVHVPERQVRRRTERAGIKAKDAAHVQVVTLRRQHERHESAESGPHVEHDHRWLVTGHWRHQPFGPGRAQRRLQWIRPHVKGPDGAPLVVKSRVNAWVR